MNVRRALVAALRLAGVWTLKDVLSRQTHDERIDAQADRALAPQDLGMRHGSTRQGTPVSPSARRQFMPCVIAAVSSCPRSIS